MTAAPKSPTVTREAIDYMRHDGLCGIVGGYGYCTCGMDDAKAALVARLAASTLREEGQRSGPIASGHDCPTCTAEYAIWPDAHQMVCHCQPYPWFPVPGSPAAVERGEVARTLAAGRIMDVMTGGKFDWRHDLENDDFLASADWATALAYADAALSRDGGSDVR